MSMWVSSSDNQATVSGSVGADQLEPDQLFVPTGQDGSASTSSPNSQGSSSTDPGDDSEFLSTTSVLRTAGDAMQFCTNLFRDQIELALAERTPPNVASKGDSAARAAFLMLLSDAQQRELFMSVGRDPKSWARLKTLVGSPPYHFLHPNDAGMLNAAGFTKGRINMTYDSAFTIANHGQFGPGQLVDEHTREYRVAPRKLEPSDPLPGAEYFKHGTRDIVLQVRVKKHGIQKKRELFHSDQKKQLLFPQPGETILLQETNRMLSARGLRNPTRTQLRVKALWPRGQGSSTAAVLVGF